MSIGYMMCGTDAVHMCYRVIKRPLSRGFTGVLQSRGCKGCLTNYLSGSWLLFTIALVDRRATGMAPPFSDSSYKWTNKKKYVNQGLHAYLVAMVSGNYYNFFFIFFVFNFFCNCYKASMGRKRKKKTFGFHLYLLTTFKREPVLALYIWTVYSWQALHPGQNISPMTLPQILLLFKVLVSMWCCFIQT